MQFSKNWLAQYNDLPEDVERLARGLTDSGSAVELIEERECASGPDGKADHVLDVDITTNRPDCMNHLGLAREAAVVFGTELKVPKADLNEVSEEASEAVRIEIEEPELCRRYVGRVIRGVTVGPSPDWLVERLESIGQRAINNVVDVTNFVLWELGQPLHAFDLATLGTEGGRAVIRVRRPKVGEDALKTLDGEERKLDPEMLLIADAEVPVALAGVMGGFDTEVTETTRDVLLEAAWFDPASVRRTAKALGMHTDASHRFERGADPEMASQAAERAAALIAELGGGQVLAGAVDVYPAPFEPRTLELSAHRVCRLAGAEIAAEDMERWLLGLGCAVESLEADGHGPRWSVTVPTWRYLDLERKEDLYEECIRIYGFDRIAATLPSVSGADGHTTAAHRRAWELRRHLAACGYQEAIDFAFHDRERDAALPGLYRDLAPLALANPLSERYAVMRRSLLPGLLESADFNLNRGASAVRLFEVGHVFARGVDGEPTEQEVLALVAGGTPGTPWEHSREIDVFDLKGILDSLGETFGATLQVRPAAVPGLMEGASAELVLNGDLVGTFGRLADSDGTVPLFVGEVATAAFSTEDEDLKVELPSKLPGVAADYTLTHSLEVPWSEIAAAVEEQAPEDLVHYGLLDRYQGKGVPGGAVNTTLHFLYNSERESLTHEQVNQRQQTLTAELERRFGWAGPDVQKERE